MSLEIHKACLQEAAEIDRFLDTRADALAYHRIQWLDAIRTAYGHEFSYLVAREDGRIVGVLPLCRFRSLSGKANLCSLPYCDVGAVVAKGAAAKRALQDFAVVELKAQGCGRLELRQRGAVAESTAVLDSQKVSMLLQLPSSSELLIQGFKSKLRSQVRKAEKNGLRFESSRDQSGIAAFYQVFANNMRDLGSPVHARKWFEALQQAYAEQMLVGLVYAGEQVVGAGIVLFASRTVSIPWASTLREFNHLAPNMWLYWNFLRIACDSGFDVFDFGRSTFGESTYRFKEQWGAKPAPLIWQTIYAGGGSELESYAPTGLSRQMVESLWKRFPLSLANFLGPFLRGRISL